MIKVIEGVRVDSNVVPHSYALADKATGIARHFKQSVQDALQELMCLELLSKEKKIKDLRGFIIASFYKGMVNGVRKDIVKEKHAKEVMSQGYFTDDEFKIIQNRIFVNELVMILKEIDVLLSRIMTTIRENTDMSLTEIYRSYYADEFGKTVFFEKIKDLKRIIHDLSESDKRSYLQIRTELVTK